MLVAPAMVGLAVLILWPLLWELNVSFTKMNIRNFMAIRGLLGARRGPLRGRSELHRRVHPARPQADDGFYQLFAQTVIWTAVNVFFHVTLGVLLALLLTGRAGDGACIAR